jgi:hypothetical protein
MEREPARGAVLRSDYRARLTGVAEAVDELRAAYEDELMARDLLILEAIDAGHSRGEVARWSRVGRTRVTQIVAARAAELQAVEESVKS